jgi:hypothetical protein
VQGIDGVVQAYEKAFEHWILSGPTNFAEVLLHERRIVWCGVVASLCCVQLTL